MPTYGEAEYCGYPCQLVISQPDHRVSYAEAVLSFGQHEEPVVLVSLFEYLSPQAVIQNLAKFPNLCLGPLTDPEPILRE